MSCSTPQHDPAISVHLTPEDLDAALRHEVRVGLTSRPKELSPKWLYDDHGCDLFDQITRLPEYYPTRAERSILQARSREIAQLTGADTLVELGSGTSEKTRLLLGALTDGGTLRRFVPFDVAEQTLREAAKLLVDEFPGLRVEGVVGDFGRHLEAIPTGGRRVIAFLGGTIGNLHPAERSAFLSTLSSTMAPGDALLLGTDLVKDRDRLVAAYDDAAGVTAAFNLNVLSMINRALGADFDLARFEHVARFDEEQSFIEMRLRARADQVVHVTELDFEVSFAEGEEMRTEISTKFTLAGVATELETAGLDPRYQWTDPAGDFALWLAFA